MFDRWLKGHHLLTVFELPVLVPVVLTLLSMNCTKWIEEGVEESDLEVAVVVARVRDLKGCRKGSVVADQHSHRFAQSSDFLFNAIGC